MLDCARCEKTWIQSNLNLRGIDIKHAKKDGVRCEQVKYRYENKQRSDVSEIVEGAGCVKTLIQFSFHSNFELQRPEAARM